MIEGQFFRFLSQGMSVSSSLSCLPCARSKTVPKVRMDLEAYFEAMHNNLQQYRNAKINSIFADASIKDKGFAVNHAYHQKLFEIAKEQESKNIQTHYSIPIEDPNDASSGKSKNLYLPRELSSLATLTEYYNPTVSFEQDFEAGLEARVSALQSKLPQNRPLIICVEGPPVGYGKTTFSKALAKNVSMNHLEIDSYKHSREKRTAEKLVGFQQYDLQGIIEEIKTNISNNSSIILDGVYSAHPDLMKTIDIPNVSVVRVGMFRAENSFIKRYENKRDQKSDLQNYQQMEMMLFVHKLEAKYAFEACESGKMDFVMTDKDLYEKKSNTQYLI